MKTDWTYNGDISLRHGGFYWKPLYDDCVEAVDVFQYPGDEDNIFRVVSDSIYMPRDKYNLVLDCCGYPHPPTFDMLVDAFNAYWGLNDTSRVFKIQIGGPRTPPCDYRLAHNASLRKFVEREFLQ